jgi:hypothetical protein
MTQVQVLGFNLTAVPHTLLSIYLLQVAGLAVYKTVMLLVAEVVEAFFMVLLLLLLGHLLLQQLALVVFLVMLVLVETAEILR